MSTRVERVAAAVQERGLDALVVTHLPNVRWLTGFTGTNGAAVVGRDARMFFTDFRYVEQAAEQVRDFDRVRAGRDLLGDLAGHLSGGRIGFEDEWLSVKAHSGLTKAVAGRIELVPASGVVEAQREVKDESELAAIRAACQLADQAYESLVERGIDGRSERQIATDLELLMFSLGAEERSFPAIVASGGHAALPHAEPRDLPVVDGSFMIVDMGCVVDGYCSDCTRTFAIGAVDDRAREVYELVARAQSEALAAVRPDAECRAVDSVAREVIEAAGHGEHFGHGLGHGVGLVVHEGPRLAQTATGTLRAGNVVSVEPGVYLPGEMGVRIEDLVVVTDDGAEILTGFPKHLITLT